MRALGFMFVENVTNFATVLFSISTTDFKSNAFNDNPTRHHLMPVEERSPGSVTGTTEKALVQRWLLG